MVKQPLPLATNITLEAVESRMVPAVASLEIGPPLEDYLREVCDEFTAAKLVSAMARDDFLEFQSNLNALADTYAAA